MCNVTIAKDKLQQLKLRTQRDLYSLKYGSEEYLPMNEETFLKVKLVCNSNDIECPLYRYAGNINFKQNTKNPIYNILTELASNHKIYLDYGLI